MPELTQTQINDWVADKMAAEQVIRCIATIIMLLALACPVWNEVKI